MSNSCPSLIVLGCAAVLSQAPAKASPVISLNSAQFVEHLRQDGRSLEPANRLNHGERVVTVLSWYRLGGSGGFTVTNPMPTALAYQASANGDEEVSVDGGRNWGRLGALYRGNRVASAEDVTHVRWRISPGQSLQGAGRIAYSGIVR